ncbi:RagB/SusD family nutrient uptake outer membrane protein [uncultured Phocaeicola sp.]|uniref:RagB/SusD family nutrient uptake outer membrane protein n=1 Tax=uncultured Phocaeicola sp. TaxID=990718 RepID=UPI0025972D9A|nr:RagB/SusD family nutrient uptake outer membrane protein [uncultured Phocaeicola sp.]
MKTKKNLLYICAAATAICGLASCNDFLDTMPDKRTEIDTPEKVRDILVSAYPNYTSMPLFEYMSDNYDDNGDGYNYSDNIVSEAYHWEDIIETDQDSPSGIWRQTYAAIAAANQALVAIEEMGNPEECMPYKGEALLCRAYGHFALANVFCMAYNEATASENLGIPYITAPETTVGITYDRGTLQEVYEKIDADIEAALPLIEGINFDVPAYHFNEKAAYAFAARFNLFYGKDYDKVINYATQAIGEDPTSVLRDLNGYDKFTNQEEWGRGYVSQDEPANLLLTTNYSRYPRLYNQRYAITRDLMNASLVWSLFPGNVQLPVYRVVFQTNYVTYFVPKIIEFFEITNPVAQTGYIHIVLPIFTTDETLLCRAEAHILKKEYDAAATDLSYWYQKKGIEAHTAAEIIEFYDEPSGNNDETHRCDPANRTPLNTGVTYDHDQTCMLYAVLHARRVETIHEGHRWPDIKRYGLTVTHNIHNGEPIALEANDLRKAIQIPEEVLSAPGNMTPNPR